MYITVIAHLTVLAILLGTQLTKAVQSETSFVLDFTNLEEMERQLEEAKKQLEQQNFESEISSQIDRMIAGGSSSLRNVAVNNSEPLKDAKGIDGDKLNEEHRKLQEKLQTGFKSNIDDGDEIVPDPGSKDGDKKEQPKYSGPSVLSWELAGRKAMSLPIPAYRCMGGGEVKVRITVDGSGKVIDAKIDDSCSSRDGCLRAYAVTAARMSRFSASDSTPRQEGNIVYKFIAQ